MREPIRCFKGTAKPYEPFWHFRDAVEGGEPEMDLYGYISEYSWYEDDITPKKFKDDLQKYGQGGPITIRMNSYGGDVIAASMIYGMIQDYPGKVTVQVEGVVASAASVVAVAADVVRMRETAYFMIHDPSAVFMFAQLNIEDLSRMVDSLKVIKEGIINAYETRTNMARSRLSKLMAAETWMHAQEAIDMGFANEIITGSKKEALYIPENAAVVNALQNFTNVPADLLAAVQKAASSSEPVSKQAVDRLRAEVRLYQSEVKHV